MRDIQIRGFTVSPQERADLIAFLEALTDERFLHDPRFSDPFVAGATPQTAPHRQVTGNTSVRSAGAPLQFSGGSAVAL